MEINKKIKNKKKPGENKNWDLQSFNVKTVILKPDMMMKDDFCDYRTFRLIDASKKIKGLIKKWRNLSPILKQRTGKSL